MANYGRNPAVRQLREDFVSCPGCGRDRDRIFNQRPHPEMHMNQCLTVEHLLPRSAGGSNHVSNLIIICHRCNFTRGAQRPWDWYGAQHLIYADGWPPPPAFYGRAGRANRLLWEQRAAGIAALLGWGPVEIPGS